MKQYRIILAATAVLLLVTSLTVAGTVKGSGKLATEQRDTGNFHGVSILGSPDAIIEVGGPVSVEVEAEDNILPLITTEVVDGILEIGSEKSYSTYKPIRVRITVPELDQVMVQGSGDIVAHGVHGALFIATVKGSGDVEVTGAVDRVEASVLGSGDIELFALEAVDGVATVKGSGDIRIQAGGTLDLKVMGSGDIRFRGGARVDKSTLGSGDIRED